MRVGCKVVYETARGLYRGDFFVTQSFRICTMGSKRDDFRLRRTQQANGDDCNFARETTYNTGEVWTTRMERKADALTIDGHKAGNWWSPVTVEDGLTIQGATESVKIGRERW